MNNRGKTCKVSGCTNNARCKGLCNKDYAKAYFTRVHIKGKKYVTMRNLVIEE